MRKTFAFAARLLVRDWRAGELRVLAVAVVIAVASSTAVGAFADRVRQAMHVQAAELLAADLVLASSSPVSKDKAAHARDIGLRTARTLEFRSVVLAGDRAQLVEVKAVGNGYPLRGTLRVAAAAYGADRPTDRIPARGEVWVESRLLQQLGLEVGAELSLGRSRLHITRVLSYEPDRGGDFFSIAPRVLMNIDDVAATQLLQAGSRASYRLLVAGPGARVADYRAWLKPRLDPGERLLDLRDGRPELRTALQRAQRFLGLASLASVLLAGVAVAMAARRYARRHLDTSAIMRCFGATQARIMQVFIWKMLMLGLMASLVGVLAGYLAQEVLATILSGVVTAELPWPSARPAMAGLFLGLLVLGGFALPPLLALGRVPPARVLRRQLMPPPVSAGAVYGVALAVMALLMWLQADDVQLLGYAIAGTALTVIVLTVGAWGLVLLLQRLRGRVGVAWRFGFANIARRRGTSVVQIAAFGLGIMLLLLISVVRSDLLERWRQSIPPDAPNHFIVNVLKEQVPAIQQFFASRNVKSAGLFPMVRARLLEINGKTVNADSFDDPRARRLALREFNLSWTDHLPADNRILAGRWWGDDDAGSRQISVEEGLAQRLGIELGDTLTFNVAGDSLSVVVSSLRKVDWDSFNVNFFTVLPPGVLEDYPATYISSFYLPADNRTLLPQLIREFPNVTVIDVAALMNKVRAIMDRVNFAVEFIFMFSLVAGLVVLYAAIQTTQDERRYESAILKTLGARRRQVLGGLIAEFTALGTLAGVLAGAIASVAAYVVATRLFGIDYSVNYSIALIGMVAGATIIGLAGTAGARSALRQTPLRTLRDTG